jgi:hypothetical protein
MSCSAGSNMRKLHPFNRWRGIFGLNQNGPMIVSIATIDQRRSATRVLLAVDDSPAAGTAPPAKTPASITTPPAVFWASRNSSTAISGQPWRRCCPGSGELECFPRNEPPRPPHECGGSTAQIFRCSARREPWVDAQVMSGGCSQWQLATGGVAWMGHGIPDRNVY